MNRRVLIETSWNVKKAEAFRLVLMNCVLIETSWNVKSYETLGVYSSMEVLIETSWNVKTSPFIFDQVYSVLIETSWNVKFKLAKRCSSFYGY